MPPELAMVSWSVVRATLSSCQPGLLQEHSSSGRAAQPCPVLVSLGKRHQTHAGQKHLQVCLGKGSRAGRIPCACCLLESLPLCNHPAGQGAARALLREPPQPAAELQEGSPAAMLSHGSAFEAPRWELWEVKGWSKQGQALPLCPGRSRAAALGFCSWKGRSGKLA